MKITLHELKLSFKTNHEYAFKLEKQSLLQKGEPAQEEAVLLQLEETHLPGSNNELVPVGIQSKLREVPNTWIGEIWYPGLQICKENGEKEQTMTQFQKQQILQDIPLMDFLVSIYKEANN